MSNDTRREARTYTMNGGNPPQQGTASALAGVAEPGDLLLVTGLGTYVNAGTKATPRWEPYRPPRDVFYVDSRK